MKSEAYLVFTAKGIDRLAKRRPGRLSSGHYAIRVRLSVPDEFFQAPVPTVDLEVAESGTLGPPAIVDLTTVEDVCVCRTFAVDGADNFRCVGCGFVTWRKGVGPHSKLSVPDTEKKAGEGGQS